MMSMKKLNKKQQNDYDNATCFCICWKQFGAHKKHIKLRDHDHYTGDYRGAAHSICNLRYSTQVDIPVAFQNGAKYDFNLLITELAKEFRSEMRCIPLNTDKYMSFSIPIKKVQKDKKCITCNLKFIDSIKFMNESLGTLVNNLSKLYGCKCINKEDQDIKIKYKEHIVNVYKNVIIKNKEKRIQQNKVIKIVRTCCKTCNAKNKQTLNSLVKKISCTYQLSNNNPNKFLLLLEKGVYPYEYMNDWNRFNETNLPPKKDFCSKIQLKILVIKIINMQKMYGILLI